MRRWWSKTPAFPGMSILPRNFTLKDEIYQIKDFSRENVRVLLSLDASKVDLSKRGIHRKDFPVIWARELWQRPSALQRPRPHPGSLGSARDPEDVARDGAMVDGPHPRRRHAQTFASEIAARRIGISRRRPGRRTIREHTGGAHPSSSAGFAGGGGVGSGVAADR